MPRQRLVAGDDRLARPALELSDVRDHAKRGAGNEDHVAVVVGQFINGGLEAIRRDLGDAQILGDPEIGGLDDREPMPHSSD